MKTYYWIPGDRVWYCRQVRFKDNTSHPHDICAVAQTPEQMVSMQDMLDGAGNFENPVEL